MALTEETRIDLVSAMDDGFVYIRETRFIYDNGVEISKTYHRRTIDPDLPPAALAAEDARVRQIAQANWTQEVRDRFEAGKARRAAQAAQGGPQ